MSKQPRDTGPGQHSYTAETVIEMEAGYLSTVKERTTLEELDLDDETLSKMTGAYVEQAISNTFEQYVWETVGDSCGWRVAKPGGS